MNIIDIINKKKNKIELSKEEIEFFVTNFTSGEIKDYQASSLAMAILINGMSKKETGVLTNSFTHSGDVIDLSSIKGVKVDKHSTGGVGDKVSLVFAPLASSIGVCIAKMSGRGLGHTGGTIDKLETFPGFTVELSMKQFIKQVNDINIAIIGQTDNLTPADKKMYALRDVSGTVDSIPLIAASIMSKKIATGSDVIILDIKCGRGSFNKTEAVATELAKTMKEIGDELGKKVSYFITDMDSPLGNYVGNSLEVYEAIKTLQGEGNERLLELCLKFAAVAAVASGVVKTEEKAIELAKENIANGSALTKLKEFIKAQGGDTNYIDNPEELIKDSNKIEVVANKDGFISDIDPLAIGKLSVALGAGRMTKEDPLDLFAGIHIIKHVGSEVKKGEVIANVYTTKKGDFSEAYLEAVTIDSKKPKSKNIILNKG